MCNLDRITNQIQCQSNSPTRPDTKDTAPHAVRIAKVDLQLSDSYLSAEEATLPGLAGLKNPRDGDPSKDSLKFYTVHGLSVAGGATLMLTKWDSVGYRALGGGLMVSGLTGVTLELLEDNKVTVKLPTYYKVGCSVLLGLLGSMAFATAGGFDPRGLGPNDTEYPIMEFGK